MNKKSSIYASFTAVFILSAAVLLICTKSSPLYPTNDWVDANCYVTIGRAMLHGKLPYRDLFEHKGPLLYIIHALAVLISPEPFFGVFLIEIIAASAFLFAAYRILRLFCGDDKRLIAAVPVTAALIYSSGAFSHGDSAEELCLPLLAYSFFFGLRALKENRPMNKKELLLTGIAAGIVFWTKFSLLGIFAVIALTAAFTAYRKSGINSAVSAVCHMASGAVIVTFPVFVLFAVNGALDDLFKVYFVNNLTSYSNVDSKSSMLTNLLDGLHSWKTFSRFPMLITFAGILAMLTKKDKKTAAYTAAAFAASFVLVFGFGQAYRYYSLTLAVFLPAAMGGIICAAKGVLKHIRVNHIILAGISAACSLTFAFFRTPNRYLMKYSRDDMPQYRFAKIIGTDSSASILNYGFLDGGFYTAADAIPEMKYFCLTNMLYPEMEDSQEFYVESRIPDYIVTRSVNEKPWEDNDDSLRLKFSFPGYELVSTECFPYYGDDYYYFLYKKQ